MITWASVVDVLVLKSVVAAVGTAAVMLLLADLVRGELDDRRTRPVRSRTRAWGLLLAVVFLSLVVLRFSTIGVA